MSLALVSAVSLSFLVSRPERSPTAPRIAAPSDTSGLPLRPCRLVQFEATEGTWISLDVSPDGQTIVFDLLGHLYTMPITGGRAYQLTSGTGRNRQPRFSPDGRQLVFISDRGGSDNVWIADRRGRNARQLSSLHGYDAAGAVVSPVWSPDGRSIIVAQKLGAIRPWGGVMPDSRHRRLWLLAAYDAATGRMRWISDTAPGRAHPMLGPAFGKHGDELYAAQDVLSDGYYLSGWRLVRVAPSTGRVSPEVNARRAGRVGVRPMVSRDGRYLVYASSSGSHFGFRIRDLRTDRERWLIREQLDDPQPSGEPRDLVPGYAFTPDGRSLIAAFRGKIRRIDLASGRVTAIPFVAPVERVLGPLTVHQFLLPDTAVASRGILQPALSPDGRAVAFSALDRIWLMELTPNGQARRQPIRLTGDSAGEFYPSWAPDGRWITYATWRDGEGGAIWRLPIAAGGKSSATRPRRLTTDGARYFNPVVSPDGERVVAVRLEPPAERVLADETGMDRADTVAPMLVWVAARGGQPRPIASLAAASTYYMGYPVRQVYFTNDPSRIYVGLTPWQWDGTSQRTPVALVARDGTAHSAAEPFDLTGVVSADGRRALVARTFELHEVHLSPGRARKGPASDTLHLERASRQQPSRGAVAARRWGTAFAPWISWSGDGRRVAFQQGGSLLIGDVQRDGWISFARLDVPLFVNPDLPQGTLVLRGAQIVTMRGSEIIRRGDLVVRGNRIAAVGPAGRVRIPREATVLDVSGTTILPGYVDIHDHPMLPRGIHAGQFWKSLLQLAYGVTATRDPAAPMDHDVFAYSERERMGDMLTPRLFSSGIPAYGTDPPVRTLDDAQSFVRSYARDFRTETFKIYYDRATDRRARQLLATAARQAHLNATAHTNGLEQALASVIDGVSGVEHAPEIEIYDDVATLFARSGTTETHTYVAAPGSLAYMVRRYGWPADWPKIRHFTPASLRADTCLSCTAELEPAYGPTDLDNLEPQLRGAARIAAKGGSVAMGAHGVVPGLGFHWEMWLHALGGMSNHDILRAATIVGATAIGHARDLGSLDPGKLADLQILERSPVDDIHNSTSVRHVMKNGRLYQGDDLTEIWPRQRPLELAWHRSSSVGEQGGVGGAHPSVRVSHGMRSGRRRKASAACKDLTANCDH